MTKPIIEVENLSKLYHLGLIGGTTLRESTERWWYRLQGKEDLCHKVGSKKFMVSANDSQTGPEPNTLWALKDISFSVQQGEIIGIIGKNGAGKSTLLKILSRITEPTSGRAVIRGRVASLLEVGTGFHPELTGRENIYLNGAILGMRKLEIDQKLDEIIAFSEIEKFIDTPVKRYSSGMYVRLAFAVAAHLEPEILLVDEVLAVGDASFQKKCLGKMSDVAKQGRTVLFVSHNMGAINRLCRLGIWLDKGQLKGCGEAKEVVDRYLSLGVETLGEVSFYNNLKQAPASECIRLLAVRIKNSDGQISSSLKVNQPFSIEIEYQILKPVSHLRIGLAVLCQDGIILFSSSDMDNMENEIQRKKGTYVDSCKIPGNFLGYGQYFVSVGSDIPMYTSHFFLDSGLTFCIEPIDGAGGHIPDGRRGLLRPNLSWEIRSMD